MSFINITTYLVDENGDYILDESNNRLIAGVNQTFEDDHDYRRIGGVIPRDKVPFVRSFRILSHFDRESWSLSINNNFIGYYPTQSAALGVLVGAMIRRGVNKDATLSTQFQGMLDRGSVIEPAWNNVTITENTPQVDISVSAFDYDVAVAGISDIFGVYLGTQTSTDGINWSAPSFVDAETTRPLTAADNGNTVSLTSASNLWSALAEDSYIRGVIYVVQNTTAAIAVSPSGGLRKDEVKNLDFVGLNPSGDATISGPQTYTAYSTGTATDVAYSWNISGDTARVTSNLIQSGPSYELTWTDTVGHPDDVVTIYVRGTSIEAGNAVVTSSTYNITLNHSAAAPSLAFSMSILDSDGGASINLGDTAVATPDASASVNIDVDNDIDYAHQWYQSVPTLDGITLTNEGS